MNKLPIAIGLAATIAAAIFLFQPKNKPPKSEGNPTLQANLKPSFEVKIPKFSILQKVGMAKFEQNCMGCHGKHATGTGNGPPLLHRYYEPNHHGDYAFYRAAQNGVRSHHWQFGNMPPVTTVNKADVTKIISYIRIMQRENGIY